MPSNLRAKKLADKGTKQKEAAFTKVMDHANDLLGEYTSKQELISTSHEREKSCTHEQAGKNHFFPPHEKALCEYQKLECMYLMMQ